MSHQTGIKANEPLKKFFSKCKDGKIRVFKVAIEDEQLVLKEHNNEKSNWEKDYQKYVSALIEENQPCYILYRNCSWQSGDQGSVPSVNSIHVSKIRRASMGISETVTDMKSVKWRLDNKNSLGYEWLFISWSPDSAAVRQKMLYASTKATLKQEFGSSQIKEELHGTIPSDITLDGYKRHKKNVAAPAPLSMREEELQEIKKTEINTDISISTKQQTLSGVAFPLTESAKVAITDMARESYNYLQLRIDISEETIHLESAENIILEKLPSKVPTDTARYHLYLFKHTHEGDYLENIVFIYSMPGYNCSVRERMLYSSCKNPLTDAISSLGLDIVKKIEIDSGAELTEQFLYDQLHPTNSLHRPKFSKPKGPPGRGPKRMTKNQ